VDALAAVNSVPQLTPTVTPVFTAGATDTPTRTATPSATTIPPTVSPTPTLCSISFFQDVHPSDYFYSAVQYLYCRGVVSGYEYEFRPYNNTTRGQLCKIVVLGFDIPVNTDGGPHFSDVSQTDPFYAYIETAYNSNIVSGYGDDTFRPANNVTRGQLSKIVVSAEGWPIQTEGGPHFSDVPISDPFYEFVETAYNREVISGYADGTFRPGNPATRGQIAKIVYAAVTSP
jgi:hypothetical protein